MNTWLYVFPATSMIILGVSTTSKLFPRTVKMRPPLFWCKNEKVKLYKSIGLVNNTPANISNTCDQQNNQIQNEKEQIQTENLTLMYTYFQKSIWGSKLQI